MRGQDDGVTLRVQPRDELPEAAAQVDINSCCGFVKHDDGWAMDQRLCNQYTTLQPARQGAHDFIGLNAEAEVSQNFVNPVVVAAKTKIARLNP